VEHIKLDQWVEGGVKILGGEIGGKIDNWGDLDVGVWLILGWIFCGQGSV